MTKVVINICYGGFGLSIEALQLWAHLQGKQTWVTKDKYGFESVTTVPPDQLHVPSEGSDWAQLTDAEKAASNDLYNAQKVSPYQIARDDKHLVQVVEQLGEAAAGHCAALKVIEIPDDVKWHVHEYDGCEHIAEDHRTWC